MKYEHEPRPLIEEHYHIRELIERQEKRTEDRIYHREQEKSRDEVSSLIRDAKPMCLTDFYCNKCGEDFRATSVKEVEADWSNINEQIAFYRSKCSKGHWCVRFITDRHRDGFWMRSRRVALDRGNHVADIIQPFETGYNLLYGKPR